MQAHTTLTNIAENICSHMRPAGMFGGDDYDVYLADDPHQPEVAQGAAPQPQPDDRDLGNGIYAREHPDGKHCLFGAPLRFAPKLLRRIFRMRQLPGHLAWVSDTPLDAAGWQYMQDAFAAERIQPLLRHGRRVLRPLPGRCLARSVVH
jgi:hypothetical protein